MIATELKSASTTVRIHDDFCKTPPVQTSISQLSQIVTNSYKRRTAANPQPVNTTMNTMMPQ